MENSLYCMCSHCEVLEKCDPVPYEIKNSRGDVVRKGSTYPLKVSAPSFIGYLKATEDIYNSVVEREVYDFAFRIYENSNLKNIKVTEII